MALRQTYDLMVQLYLEPAVRLLKTLNLMLKMTFEIKNNDNS